MLKSDEPAPGDILCEEGNAILRKGDGRVNTVEKLWAALEDVVDPEVGVNIVDLGLVYDIQLDEQQDATITMTLTVRGCPLQDTIVGEVERKAKSVPGVRNVHVNLVWEPAWNPTMMNEKAIEEIRRRRALV